MHLCIVSLACALVQGQTGLFQTQDQQRGCLVDNLLQTVSQGARAMMKSICHVAMEGTTVVAL